MNLKALFVAGALALALLLPGGGTGTAPAFADTVAVTGDSITTPAPIVVAATPATTEAVKEAAWWSKAADVVISGLASVAGLAVAALAVPLFNYIRRKSTLAALFVTQAMVDKMVAGIQNIIRAQATELEHRLGTDQLSPEQKKQVAAAAQPKVEKAFKETLARVGKKPGSQDIQDLILGHVDQALAKPALAIPGVMARS